MQVKLMNRANLAIKQQQQVPYTLHPTPYTLHPTPYTLHPTPYTLNQEYYEWLETTKIRQEDISMWITVLYPQTLSPSSSSLLLSSLELSDTKDQAVDLR